MIVDMRTYTVPVGLLQEFLSLYAQEGRAVQTRHPGEPLGYYTTEVGELGQVVHLWNYRDHADRDARRARLEADPDWRAYRAKAGTRGHVVRQVTSILRPVDFGDQAAR